MEQNEINIYGCRKHSEQVLFNSSRIIRDDICFNPNIFDYPGKFYNFSDRQIIFFSNVSFIRHPVLMFSKYEIQGNINFNKKNFGRVIIFENRDFSTDSGIDKLEKFLDKNEIPSQFLDKEVNSIVNIYWDWIRSNARYDSEKIGIPHRISIKNNDIEVGFRSPAYFLNETFVTPFVNFRQDYQKIPTFREKIRGIRKILNGENNVSIGEWDVRDMEQILNRVNLSKEKIEIPKSIKSLGVEKSFDRLKEYIIRQPLVKRDDHVVFSY